LWKYGGLSAGGGGSRCEKAILIALSSLVGLPLDVLDVDDSLVMGGESAFHRDVRFGVLGIDMQLFDSVWTGRREMENMVYWGKKVIQILGGVQREIG